MKILRRYLISAVAAVPLALGAVAAKSAGIVASNGVIHVIDTVVLPK